MEIDALDLIKIHSAENLGEGTPEEKIVKLEEKLKVQIPTEYRNFLKKIGYAEIFGDEIYSIYGSGNIPCLGIYYQNKNNRELEKGFLEFFSNDLDGVFYLNLKNGEVSCNSTENLFSKSFNKFIIKLLND
jgi:hypothetical protein